MPSTTYVPGTLVTSTWLNEVNVAVFTTIPTLAPSISPSFTTPSLGVATATSINKNNFTTPAANVTWTLASGKTFTVSNTLTLAGTDSSTLNIGTGGTLGTAAYTAATAYPSAAFTTIAVATQSNVVADSVSDTLTLVGGGGTTITTNAGTDTITITTPTIATTLLSVTTPTAASTIDLLNVFTSTYDNYLVIFDGLLTSAGSSGITLRFANAGVVDTSTHYYLADYTTSTPAGPNSSITVAASSSTATGGMTGRMEVFNVNAASPRIKTIHLNILSDTGAGAVTAYRGDGYYGNGGGTISGFRLTSSVGNFQASGTIRIYGYSNT